MFCHKCGMKVGQDASFCTQCGTKIVQEDITQKPYTHKEYTGIVEPLQQPFQAYLDDHIQKNTKFRSAEDFLHHSRPMRFLWYCYGIPAIVGLIAGGPLGALSFGFIFGHTARLMVGWFLRSRYIAETIGRYDGEIDTNHLLCFLNEQLRYLYPYFHEWRHNGAGALSVSFGEKQKSRAIIYISSDETDSGPGKVKYVFDAENNPSMLFNITRTTIFSALQISDPKHTCLFKTVPILQAAMEYYLKNNKTEGEYQNVLL